MNSIRTEATPAHQVSLPCVSLGGERTEISSSSKKLRRGGPRENSGGARVGAGRKRRRKEFVEPPPIRLPTTPGSQWYCVQTFPGCEPLAAADIRTLGLSVLLMQARETVVAKRGNRDTRERLVPRFPCYLLVAFDVSDPTWRAIYQCGGVDRVLGVGPERPIAVPSQRVERLLRQCEPNGVMTEVETDLASGHRPVFEVGTQVEVLNGPFTSFPGQVKESDEHRLIVEISVFGRSTPAELRYSDVRKV